MAAHDRMIVAAVLVAAGSGSRLGADIPKAFVTVGGRTLLEHAAARFAGRVRDVVVAAPAGHRDDAARLVADATVVAGGATRQQSVAHGLAALAPDVDVVLVHDVARAFVPADMIDRVIAAAADTGAAVPVLPVTDTIRRTGDAQTVGPLVDRSHLLAMQTPQGFTRDLLLAAHEAAATAAATDDVALVAALGTSVTRVPGDPRAFKITVPWDLLLAEALLASARGGRDD